jgi:phage shock protein E
MKKTVKILLIGCAMLLTMSSTCEEEIAGRAASSEVIIDLDPAGFRDMMIEEPGMLIDVRTPEEFTEAHIAGAVNIDISSDEFKPAINALDKDKPYYVYCHAGARSVTAACYMEEIGFTRIYNLQDGIASWMQLRMPVIREVVPDLGLPQAAN